MDEINEKLGDIKAIKKIISRVGIGLIVLILIFNTFGTIGAGERGVLLQFGAVQDKVFGEGLYFKIPFIQHVVKVDVKIQKDEIAASAASKDLQVVTSKIALNFHLAPESVNRIWQDVGHDYNIR